MAGGTSDPKSHDGTGGDFLSRAQLAGGDSLAQSRPCPSPSRRAWHVSDPEVAAVLAWWDENRRPLPWRATRDLYAIWVAEVMSAQTTVIRAAEAWERWMARWPTVDSLAAATLTEVLALWQGLGYPRRARDLHRSARIVAESGWPDDLTDPARGGRLRGRRDPLLRPRGAGAPARRQRPPGARAPLSRRGRHRRRPLASRPGADGVRPARLHRPPRCDGVPGARGLPGTGRRGASRPPAAAPAPATVRGQPAPAAGAAAAPGHQPRDPWRPGRRCRGGGRPGRRRPGGARRRMAARPVGDGPPSERLEVDDLEPEALVQAPATRERWHAWAVASTHISAPMPWTGICLTSGSSGTRSRISSVYARMYSGARRSRLRLPTPWRSSSRYCRWRSSVSGASSGWYS